jgi:hypothetical protein
MEETALFDAIVHEFEALGLTLLTAHRDGTWLASVWDPRRPPEEGGGPTPVRSGATALLAAQRLLAAVRPPAQERRAA